MFSVLDTERYTSKKQSATKFLKIIFHGNAHHKIVSDKL